MIKKITGFVIIAILSIVVGVSSKPDYRDALHKSILFFQAQRSGKLPDDQAIKWRTNSGLNDGSVENVSLILFLSKFF